MRIDPSPLAKITGTGAGGTSALSGGTGSQGGLDASRDQFLRLFVAQLENQNPLDPQSGADMVAQLAQFSSLEQQVEGNRRLEALVSGQQAAAGAGLADLAGRTISADLGVVTIDGPVALSPIEVVGQPAPRSGELVVRSAAGAVVRRVPLVPGDPPTASWDGRDARGVPVERGSYLITIEGTDAEGAAVEARPRLRATVDAVELGADGARLRLGGLLIAPGAVAAILGPRGGAS